MKDEILIQRLLNDYPREGLCNMEVGNEFGPGIAGFFDFAHRPAF
jgi:hypothetical protein